MSTMKRMVDSWAVFMLSIAGFALFAIAHFWPASFWLDVVDIKAGHSQVGSPVPMLVKRTIHRPFLGRWTVSIKRFGKQGWVNHCSASGQTQYRPGSELPADLDLRWWTGDVCKMFPEGRYIVETHWTIQPAMSFLPEKTVAIVSNIFEVTP